LTDLYYVLADLANGRFCLFFPNFFLDNGLFFPNYSCFHIERQPQHGFPMMLVINQTRQRALLATIACVPSPRIGLVDGLTTEIRALPFVMQQKS